MRVQLVALVVAALASLPATAAVQVTISSPLQGEVVMDALEVRATVHADEPVQRVDFFVDGALVGSSTSPPWRMPVDLGPGMRGHSFIVVAHTDSGASGSAVVTTPQVDVGGEVAVELQQVYVTVERGGERARGLGPERFQVLDDDAEQRIVTFAAGDVPLTAIILVDSSQSMVGEPLIAARESVRRFARGMRPLDEAQLMVVSDHVLAESPFTTVPEVLTTGLIAVREQGGTAVYDHLYESLRRLEGRQGRRVIVLLSDGVDNHSVLDIEQVAWAARRSRSSIYWVRLRNAVDGQDIVSVWRDAKEYRRQPEQLERVVAESGGRTLPVDHLEQLAGAFAEILDELHDQYAIGYYPSVDRDDGSWHRVRVEVDGGLEAHTREGYTDF